MHTHSYVVPQRMKKPWFCSTKNFGVSCFFLLLLLFSLRLRSNGIGLRLWVKDPYTTDSTFFKRKKYF